MLILNLIVFLMILSILGFINSLIDYKFFNSNNIICFWLEWAVVTLFIMGIVLSPFYFIYWIISLFI